MENKNHNRYFSASLAHGCALLQMFSEQKAAVNLADISHALGVSRSSAFRLAYTLEHLGFLRKIKGSKKYQLSPKVLSLGFGFLSGLDLIESTRETLMVLGQELGVSTHLVQRDGLDVVYLARYTANGHIASNVHVGTRFPVHATALGQVLLADFSDEEIANIFQHVSMAHFTKHTPTNVEDLIERVSLGRKQGYLESWGFFEKGLASIAAPIRDNSGVVLAAINITCSIAQFSRFKFSHAVAQQVLVAAKDLSCSLGYQEKKA